MHCRACSILFTLALAILATNTARAQVVIQPTASPTVTAENEPWYLNGEPVTHAGSLYYPAGPRVYFNANEMVRSGFHMGIPLYTRTTIEPYSVVYLPVGPRCDAALRAAADRIACGDVRQHPQCASPDAQSAG